MRTSAAGRTAIAAREGKRLVAYRDSVGVLTIGVGHTGRMSPPAVTAGMRITPEQCDAFLASDLAPVEAAINGLGVPLTQNQFDALASFAFNIGVAGFKGSNVASCLKHGLYTNAAEALMNWVKPAVLRGRRESERKQFLTPDAAAVSTRPVPSAASPIIEKTINPLASPSRGPSPAPASATSATKDTSIMGNLLGTVASMVFGAATKAQTVATVATAAPTIIEGAFKSIDEAERGIKALVELGNDIRGGKWNEVPDDVTAILTEFRKIMMNFGIDHDKLNVAAAKVADLDSVATLKAKAA